MNNKSKGFFGSKSVVSAFLAAVFMCGVVLTAAALTGGSEATEIHFATSGEGFGTSASSGVDSSYTVEYDRMIWDLDMFLYDSMPHYEDMSSYRNSCGPIAGANILGFFDRWIPDLIPDFNVGITVQGNYIYLPATGSMAVQNTINTLYTNMKTNSTGAGVTESNFKSALKNYVASRGHTLTFTSIYGNSTIVNLNTYNQELSFGNCLAVLFLKKYNFITSREYDSSGKKVTVTRRNYDQAHIMVTYGFETVGYVNSTGFVHAAPYLQAISGFSPQQLGYIELQAHIDIAAAYTVKIS